MRLEAPKKVEPTPAPVGEPKPTRAEPSTPLLCRTCGQVITHQASRREVGGRHEHLRLNPAAFAFIFGCFSEAPGCLVDGLPTDEATWFPGSRWQYAHCAKCQAHLGLAFSGGDSFFGLLLERLVEEPYG